VQGEETTISFFAELQEVKPLYYYLFQNYDIRTTEVDVIYLFVELQRQNFPYGQVQRIDVSPSYRRVSQHYAMCNNLLLLCRSHPSVLMMNYFVTEGVLRTISGNGGRSLGHGEYLLQ